MAIDGGSLVLAIQSVKSASDVLKVLRAADKSLETAEFKLQIADLATALADAKIQLADVHQYVRDLESRAALQESLTFDREANVYRDDAGSPFCPKCFDGEGKACRMEERSDEHYWRCLTCRQLIEKPGPAPPIPPVYNSGY